MEIPAASACGPIGCGVNNSGYDAGCSTCGVSGAAYISDGSISNAMPGPDAMQVGPMIQNGTVIESIGVPTPILEGSPQMPPVMQPGQPVSGPQPNAAGALEAPTTYQATSTPWKSRQGSRGTQATHTRSNPYVPATAQRPRSSTNTPGLMGPIGYDVE